MELKSYYAQDKNGEIIPGAYVYLYEPGTTTLVYGHQDAKGASLSNPFQADEDGLIQFAAPDGRYDLRVTGGGLDRTIPIQCLDSTAAVSQVASDADRAELEADRAEAARDSAQVNAGIYADTTSGLSATTEGDYFSVPSSDDDEYLILYRHDAGPVATEVSRYPSANAVRHRFYYDSFDKVLALRERQRLSSASAAQKAAVVILLGQSLNVARNGIVKFSANSHSFMLNGGAHLSSFQFWSTNPEHTTNFSDVQTSAALLEQLGQSPCVGIASTLVGGKYPRLYIGSVAIGSRGMGTLMTGGPRCNLYAFIERLCEISRSEGYEPEVLFYSAHGEADASAGTTEQDYYDRAMTYYRMAQLAAAQYMQVTDYIAPVFLTHPLQNREGTNGEDDRAISSAIARVAQDLEGGIDLGPIYQWPATSDRIHPTPTGYVERGEFVGQAMRDLTEKSISSFDLKMVDVVLDGSTFTVTFNRDVVRDISNTAGTNLNTSNALDGFEWLDNGAFIQITGLTYNGRTVSGTLASVPVGTIDQQLLLIASQATTSTVVNGSENHSGSQVRADAPAGKSIVDPSVTQYQWANKQQISVRSA